MVVGCRSICNHLVDSRYVKDSLLETDYTTILLGPGAASVGYSTRHNYRRPARDDLRNYLHSAGGLIVGAFPGPPVEITTLSPGDIKSPINTVSDAIDAGFKYAKVKHSR